MKKVGNFDEELDEYFVNLFNSLDKSTQEQIQVLLSAWMSNKLNSLEKINLSSDNIVFQ